MPSFRRILALGIVLGALGLVASATITRIGNPRQSAISPVDALIAEINPFWRMPDIFEASQSSVTFPIPIENTTDSELLPKGKITLHEADGTQLRGIGTE